VRRVVIHGLAIGLLLAVGAGFVVSLRWPWGAPGPLGFFGIAALVVGGLGLVACVPAGWALQRGRRVPPLALLAAPVGCLVLAGIAVATETPATLRELGGEYFDWSLSQQSAWLANVLPTLRYRVVVALFASTLGFMGSVLAAGCVSPAPNQTPLRTLRWSWLGWGVAGSVTLFTLFLARALRAWLRIDTNGLQAAWPDLQADLQRLLFHEQGWALWLPFAIVALLLMFVPVALWRCVPMLEEIEAPPPIVRTSGFALATASTLGLGVSAGLLLLTYSATRSIDLLLYLLHEATSAEKMALFPSGMITFCLYHAAFAVSLAVLLIALGLAAPPLLSARHHPARFAVPLATVLGAALLFMALQTVASRTADQVLGVHCEQHCNELDRVHSGLTFQQWQSADVMDYDRSCGHNIRGGESQELRLPRVDVPNCPEVGVVLTIRRDQILVDGIKHAQLGDGRFPADVLSDGWFHAALYDTLAEKAEESLNLAQRARRYRFRGTYLIEADADTPMVTVDIVRRTAAEAGFDDTLFVVALPERHDPPWLRAMRVDPRYPSEEIWTLEGEEWTLLLDLDEARLVSPDGAVDIVAHQPEELVTQVRPHVVARGAPTTIVNVTHHPDFPLQEELQYRAALTRDQLFSVAYTANPPALVVDAPAPTNPPPAPRVQPSP
jgi:hypothetical protein